MSHLALGMGVAEPGEGPPLIYDEQDAYRIYICVCMCVQALSLKRVTPRTQLRETGKFEADAGGVAQRRECLA